MDCPAALWLSRTDVSCDKHSCCCHPGRADTLHITERCLPSLSTPPPLFGQHHSCPKMNLKWEDLSGFVCCKPWFAATALQMERRYQAAELRAAAGQHLPQAWPGGTEAHLKQTVSWSWWWRKTSFYTLCLPLKQYPPLILQRSSCLSNMGQMTKSFSYLSLPLQPDVPHSFFLRHSCVFK